MMRLRMIILTMLTLSCLSLWPKQLSDSVRVHFRVNKIVIDPALMANDSSMRSFDRRMAQLSQLNDLPDFRVTIDSILITGAASPEGSIPLNEYLSRERAGAITRWLRGFFEFPDTMPRVVFKGRDWQGLLAVTVSDPHVPYKAEVVDLLNDIINTPPQSVIDETAWPGSRPCAAECLIAICGKNIFPDCAPRRCSSRPLW